MTFSEAVEGTAIGQKEGRTSLVRGSENTCVGASSSGKHFCRGPMLCAKGRFKVSGRSHNFKNKIGLRTGEVFLESLAHLRPSSSSSVFSFTQLDFPGETGHVYSLGRSLSPSWRTRSGTRHLWILWILWIWNGCGWLEFFFFGSSNDLRCCSSWRCWRSMFRSLALTLRNRLADWMEDFYITI